MDRPYALLSKRVRTQPYYIRDLAHICSFVVKGECKRGEECPYRYEMPLEPTGPLAKQNFKDRYYGTNDPVAQKMLKRASGTDCTLTPGSHPSLSLTNTHRLSPHTHHDDANANTHQRKHPT